MCKRRNKKYRKDRKRLNSKMESDTSSNSDTEIATLEIQEGEDVYITKIGAKIHRVGKIFSYTFWRTQIDDEIFWSVQGHNEMGDEAWVTTQYFGTATQAGKYKQQVTLTHPTEKKIKMRYYSTISDGLNVVYISKNILDHFKNKDNSFDFDFKIMRTKRKPYPMRNF